MPTIPLLHGRTGEVVATTVVDEVDYSHLSYDTWRLGSKGYATRSVSTNGVEVRLLLHRLIATRRGGVIPPGFEVDHIDRDKLNNRRANLRLATSSQNQHNTPAKSSSQSRVRGVSWQADKGKYRAEVYIRGTRTYLGYYHDVATAGAVVAAVKEKIIQGVI